MSEKPENPVIKAEGANLPSLLGEAAGNWPLVALFYTPDETGGQELASTMAGLVENAPQPCQLVLLAAAGAKEILEQLQVRVLPACFVFVDGRPQDGFFGVPPPETLQVFMARFTGGAVSSQLEEGKAKLAEGASAEAAAIFSSLLEREPQNPEALAGLVEAYWQQKDIDRAKALLDAHPDISHEALGQWRARLDLAEKMPNSDNEAELRHQIEAAPENHQARFDLALVLEGAGDRLSASEALLEIIRRAAKWNEEAARKQLLEFFAAWGAEDPATQEGRRQLAKLLFR